MNKKRVNRIIREIAKREKISESEVRAEMEKAILAGFQNPETRQKWDEMFGAGKIPSVEEFIMKAGTMI